MMSSERTCASLMNAVCVHRFGGPEALVYEQVSRPAPGPGQVLVRVRAAGVGPWDAWIRSGRSVIPQPLPLIPGSDLSGVVEDVGPGVSGFRAGDEVFGVTNARFVGAYAEYAIAEAAMIAHRPRRVRDAEAAAVPVVASTAWQMVYEHGRADLQKRVLVHGAAGNVGACAVQLARRTGAEVIATARGPDLEYVRGLGADRVIDVQAERFEDRVRDADLVIDTVGGAVQDRSFGVLKRGGMLVSSVAAPDAVKAAHHGICGVFFLVDVTSTGLARIAELLDAGHLSATVGELLPLADARRAHEMLAGYPHKRGKIVLDVGG